MPHYHFLLVTGWWSTERTVIRAGALSGPVPINNNKNNNKKVIIIKLERKILCSAEFDHMQIVYFYFCWPTLIFKAYLFCNNAIPVDPWLFRDETYIIRSHLALMHSNLFWIDCAVLRLFYSSSFPLQCGYSPNNISSITPVFQTVLPSCGQLRSKVVSVSSVWKRLQPTVYIHSWH